MSVFALNSLVKHRDVHQHGSKARVKLDLREKVHNLQDEHVRCELLLEDEAHNYEGCNQLTESVQSDLPASKGEEHQKAEKRASENTEVFVAV